MILLLFVLQCRVSTISSVFFRNIILMMPRCLYVFNRQGEKRWHPGSSVRRFASFWRPTAHTHTRTFAEWCSQKYQKMWQIDWQNLFHHFIHFNRRDERWVYRPPRALKSDTNIVADVPGNYGLIGFNHLHFVTTSEGDSGGEPACGCFVNELSMKSVKWERG